MFLLITFLFIHVVCVCRCAHPHIPQHMCRIPRTICGNWFSLSGIQVLEIELRSPRLGSKYCQLLSHLASPRSLQNCYLSKLASALGLRSFGKVRCFLSFDFEFLVKSTKQWGHLCVEQMLKSYLLLVKLLQWWEIKNRLSWMPRELDSMLFSKVEHFVVMCLGYLPRAWIGREWGPM